MISIQSCMVIGDRYQSRQNSVKVSHTTPITGWMFPIKFFLSPSLKHTFQCKAYSDDHNTDKNTATITMTKTEVDNEQQRNNN